MGKKKTKANYRRTVLRLPLPGSRRVYQYAIEPESRQPDGPKERGRQPIIPSSTLNN